MPDNKLNITAVFYNRSHHEKNNSYTIKLSWPITHRGVMRNSD